MKAQPHVIDIDRIVLHGVDVMRPGRAGALLEAQIAQALAGVPGIQPEVVPGESGIAREVTLAVMAGLRGARNGP